MATAVDKSRVPWWVSNLIVPLVNLTLALLVFLFYSNMIENNLVIILMIIFSLSLVYQVKIFDKDKPKNCLKAFKVNNLSGLILFSNILIISLN